MLEELDGPDSSMLLLTSSCSAAMTDIALRGERSAVTAESALAISRSKKWPAAGDYAKAKQR